MSASQLNLLLASESPRRRELLAALGLSFAVRPADVNETPLADETPEGLAVRLSNAKAAAVALHAAEALVIAADTLVVLDGLAMSKPESPEEALAMLRALRGRTHQVLTGLTLRREPAGELCTQVAVTPVQMRPYSDAEMQAYVASGDPMDKAGAYAVQNHAFAPVAALHDCYANVVGLPLCHLYRALTRWGVAARHPLDVCPWPLAQGGCAWAAAILDAACEFTPQT